MINHLVKAWYRVGFIIKPDLYAEKLKQSPWYFRLYHSYDIIRLKKSYKKQRKKQGAVNTMKEVYRTVDTYMADYIEQTQPTITCKKGCSFCCSKQVTVSDDEAKIIHNYILENNLKLDFDRAHSQASNKIKTPLKFKQCIFLNLNTNACNIYEVRPLSCRMLLASNDPMFCSEKQTKDQLFFILPKMENLKTAIWNSSIAGILPAMIMKQFLDEMDKKNK
ncbi:MAG: YkgJ family cysteine cluster protein [Flavobacteriales bacterium]|jgi:Fe-S-cluster containining protein|nr:YkgJ family cysteine cluster protein [Flavobacteriales bacterium]